MSSAEKYTCHETISRARQRKYDLAENARVTDHIFTPPLAPLAPITIVWKRTKKIFKQWPTFVFETIEHVSLVVILCVNNGCDYDVYGRNLNAIENPSILEFQ